MIKLCLAYPSRFHCDVMRTALENSPDLYVVGCAGTAEELRFLLPHSDVVLLADDLSDATAHNLLNEIRTSHPNIKVLVSGVDDCPQTIVSYLEAGAAGYILQNDSVDDMVSKLKAVHEDKALVSPTVAAALLERLACLANLDAPLAFLKARKNTVGELTAREREVLDLIARGYTNQEIADKLVIECGTVKNHVHNILRKLEVNNRQEAASVFQVHHQPAMAMAV